MIKQLYQDIGTKAQKAMEEQSLSPTIQSNFTELRQRLENYRVVVPIIGSFSAGKTSLVNSLIGRELLTVDVTPETAIATELHFSAEERVEFVRQDGSFDTHPISQLSQLKASNFQFQRVFINSPILAQNPEMVLVDMPGLGSGIEAHNKSILTYIEKGSAFIIVIDVEDGTIRQSNINFIREVIGYGFSISILINKIDKKTGKDVQLVMDNVTSLANSQFGKEIFIGKTSATTGDLSDFSKLLTQYTIEAFIKNIFRTPYQDIFALARGELQTRMNGMVLSFDELELQIKNFQKQRQDLEQGFENEKRKVKRDFVDDGTEEILQEVKSALLAQSKSIAEMAQRNPDALKSEINEIIRPILIKKTKAVIDLEVAEHLERFQKIMNETSTNPNDGVGVVSSLLDQIKSPNNEIIGKTISSIVDKINSPMINKIYKIIVGALGILTTVIAPWLEVILLFVPEILGFLTGGKNQHEAEKAQKIEDEVKYNVIPQITSKLRPEISNSLKEIETQILAELEQNFRQELVRIEEVLNKIKEEKEGKTKDHEENRQQILNHIDFWLSLTEELN